MTKLSIVIPVCNEQENLPLLMQEIYIQLTRLNMSDYQIIYVDDGSVDQSLEILTNLKKEDDNICIISFARNFGYEAAVLAGLSHSSGEYIMVMDADMQDPPSLIYDLYTYIVSSRDDVVLAQRDRRHDSWRKNTTARLFYRLVNLGSNISMPIDVGYCRICHHKVIQAVLKCGEYNRFLKGLWAYVGFRTGYLTYERVARTVGETKFNFSKLLRLASQAIFAFSTFPLKIVTILGLVTAGFGFIIAIIQIYLKLTQGDTQTIGISTNIVLMSLIGGVQLLGLGIIGEYIARIYDETKHRPIYIIDKILD